MKLGLSFRRSISAGTAVLAAVALTACGGGAGKTTQAAGSFDDLVAAAKKEGTVTLLGGQADGPLKLLADGFGKQYGITVQYQRISTGEQEKVVDQQFKTGQVQFDVSYLIDEHWVREGARKNRWAKLDPAQLPEMSRLPQQARNDYYLPISRSVLGVVYNTARVPADRMPKTSDDLIDPRWSGRVALVDPAIGGPSAVMTFYEWKQKYGDKFPDFLKSFFSLKPRMVSDASAGTQLVAAGELDLQVIAAPSFATAAKAKGGPVEITYPQPTAQFVRTAQVAAAAPHPNAARLLANYMLSPAGQDALNGNGEGIGPYPGATKTGLPEPVGVATPDPDDVSAQTRDILAAIQTAKGQAGM